MKFYLGTHHPYWLGRTSIPLFVSYRQLRRQKSFPRARGAWALDSGAYSEIVREGRWSVAPREYIDAVKRYQSEIGGLEWAAIQDWTCGPKALARTGMTIRTHQRKTVRNLCELRSRAPGIHWLPVLQGWQPEDYLRHIDDYGLAGISLTDEILVGVGSLAGRQRSPLIPSILKTIADAGVRTHGFGLSFSGISRASGFVRSADSLGWSYTARKRGIQLPQCRGQHSVCNNCITYAMIWRRELVRRIRSIAWGTDA